MTLLLTVCSGAWADVTYKEFSEGVSYYAFTSTNASAAVTAGWMDSGYGIITKAGTINPATGETVPSQNFDGIYVKARNASANRRCNFYITNVTELVVYGVSGSGERRIWVIATPTDGTTAITQYLNSNAGTTAAVTVSLDKDKKYKIECCGTNSTSSSASSNGADCAIHGFKVTVPVTKTISTQTFTGVKVDGAALTKDAAANGYTVSSTTITLTNDLAVAAAPTNITLTSHIVYTDDSEDDEDVAVSFGETASGGYFSGTATIGDDTYTVKVPELAISTQALNGVKINGTLATEDTDYTLSGTTITLTGSYLSAPTVSLVNHITYSNNTTADEDIAVSLTGPDSNLFTGTAAIGGTTYTVNVPYDTTPTLTVSASSLTVTSTKYGREKVTFNVSGANLADNIALSLPTTSGLSIDKTSVAVTDGTAAETAITVAYCNTAAASGSVDITVSSGEVSKTVTVNYSSTAYTASALADVTGSQTWDFSKVTTTDAIPAEAGFVTLSDHATYTDVSTDNLAVSGIGNLDFTFRKGESIQGAYVKFHTTVPGTLTVKFSDVGSSSGRANRYANVNGTRSDVSSNSSKTTVTSSAIPVQAGDVLIKGEIAGSEDTYSDTQIRIFEIVFTATTSTTVTVGDKLYRTFASKWPLTFPVEGLTAYKANVTGDNVTFEEVTGNVPAGEGLLLKATAADTYTISVPAGEVATIDNALVGVTKETTIEGAGIFVLYADDTHPIGFYKTEATSFTVGANTAYLPANTSARTFIALDEETTGIGATLMNSEKVNSEVYNLNGQRVAQPSKGLYIVNGRKVVIK